MRKTGLLLVVSALLATSSAMAAKKPVIDQADEGVSGQGYGMAGCGLGSIVFGQKPGLIQIFASTTNGTFGSQTFGISTGTSNCTPDGQARRSAELFITVNKEVLAKDISRGNGEALASLSEIIGCSDAKLLGGKLQQNFRSIFPTQKTSADESGRAIFDVIKGDAALTKTCAKIS